MTIPNIEYLLIPSVKRLQLVVVAVHGFLLMSACLTNLYLHALNDSELCHYIQCVKESPLVSHLSATHNGLQFSELCKNISNLNNCVFKNNIHNKEKEILMICKIENYKMVSMYALHI